MQGLILVPGRFVTVHLVTVPVSFTWHALLPGAHHCIWIKAARVLARGIVQQ
jgi:hypothetical protein